MRFCFRGTGRFEGEIFSNCNILKKELPVSPPLKRREGLFLSMPGGDFFLIYLYNIIIINTLYK